MLKFHFTMPNHKGTSETISLILNEAILSLFGTNIKFDFVYRIQILELAVGMYLLHCAIYNILFGHNHFFIYLLLQAGAFFIVGVGYVGTFVPN